MIFSVKVLRPLFADIEESQGKYSSHQIDAIKGMEGVKAASAESSFRDAMLNEFLSVSQKIFKSSFIMMSRDDSVLQSIGLLSTAIFLCLDRRHPGHSRTPERRRIRGIQFADGDGLRRYHAHARGLGQYAVSLGVAKSAE